MRLVLIAFFLEVGLVLTVAPWSRYWERNYFGDLIPLVGTMITNNFVSGAVSGLGLVNIAVAVSELLSIFAARRIDSPVLSINRHSEEQSTFATSGRSATRQAALASRPAQRADAAVKP